MSKEKKWLVRIGVFLGIIIALLFIFHDNTDTEKIAKEQEISSEKAANEQLNLLNTEDFNSTSVASDSSTNEL
jgi:cell division protein FtsB